MRLSLKDWDGALVAPMADDSKLLGYYSPEDGWTIHIHDIDTHSASASGWLEDVSLVKKYEMSDEEYTKRGDTHSTYRKWKNEQLKKDPTWCVEKHMAEKRGEVWVPPEGHRGRRAPGGRGGRDCRPNRQPVRSQPGG